MDAPATPERIVCGVDESAAAARAARLAARLAVRTAARLVLVHVAPPPRLGGRSLVGAYERAERQVAFDTGGYMHLVLAPIDVEDVEVERVVEFGEPAEVLREVARARGAWLLVVGGQGAAAITDALFGSTIGALVERAPCPVVVVPSAAAEAAFEGPVVCGVDGSPEAGRAAAEAARLASRLDADLVLCTVGGDDEEPPLPSAGGVEVELVRRSGPPADELIALARDRDAAAIAVGSRGRGAVAAAMLGSVSRTLVARADRPVLVVTGGG